MKNYKYPKDVIDDVVTLRDIPKEIKDDFILSTYNYELADNWLMSVGRIFIKSIKKYMHYLEYMMDSFRRINYNFILLLPGRDKDRTNAQTSPEEMLAIASYLYILDSYGIDGAVLECGCFMGYSSCCLSLVCDYLERKLIVADSFEGLLESNSKSYNRGEFMGGLNDVRNHIDMFGRLSAVEFIKGFFNESLKGFNRNLCAIWMDVDLYQSVLDVLNNTNHLLAKDGLLFSHEMESHMFSNNKISDDVNNCYEVAIAIKEFFGKKQLMLSGCYLAGCTGVFTVDSLQYEPSHILWKLIDPSKTNYSKLNLNNYKHADDFLQYCIDKQESRDGELLIEGWALDRKSQKPLAGIFIDNGKEISVGIYGVNRNDLIIAFDDNRYKYAGFSLRSPSSTTIRIICLNSDMTEYAEIFIRANSEGTQENREG